jgi:hypothetical protein
LNFRASVVEESLELLRTEIAHVLADVFRLANGTYWPLHSAMLEEPMKKWQQENADATEDDADKEWNRLLQRYFAEREKESAAVLHRWGITAQ